MSVVDPGLGSLERIIENAYEVKWSRLSALIIMLWDHIICLDKEIELVWKRPWTRFTILYTMIRYGAGMGVAFYVLGYVYPRPSHLFCLVWVMFEGYSGSFATATVQLVLAARIWGLYGNSKRMLYILGGALSASLAGMLTVWALHTSFALSFTAKVGELDFFVCHETQAAPYIWLFWVPPLAYDTFVCYLAIYKGYRTYQANFGSRKSLMQLVVRDSIIYFIAIAIAELTVMLMWLTSGGHGIIMQAPTTFAGVIPLVMCCHLILNLRDSYYEQSTITITQGAELSELNSYSRNTPNRELDSMGLPRFSVIVRADSDE